MCVDQGSLESAVISERASRLVFGENSSSSKREERRFRLGDQLGYDYNSKRWQEPEIQDWHWSQEKKEEAKKLV